MPGIINLSRGFVFKFPEYVQGDWNEADVKGLLKIMEFSIIYF